MKVTKKNAVFGLLVFAALLSQSASASVPGAPLSYGRDNMSARANYSLMVDCGPCELISDPFLANSPMSKRDQDLGPAFRLDLAQVWERIGLSSQGAEIHPTHWSAGLTSRDGTSLSLQGVDFLLDDTTGSGEQSPFLSSLSSGETVWRKRTVVPWEGKESEMFALIGAVASGVRVASDDWGVGL
ncbi:MAG: hypothetical protein ACYSR6_03405 [Planctomycetota bacterium]|jgi:hypothetical protein